MKIELKHLAPYLPYGLKILHFSKVKKMNAGTGSSNYWIGITALIQRQGYNCKPILRPLSDLTKEIEVNGERFVTYKVIEKELLLEGFLNFGETEFRWTGFYNDNKNYIPIYMQNEVMPECPFSIVKKLFEWHFDVFGLIDAGLAIDINNIKQ